MEKRQALLSALSQLRSAHPELPQLRDFQVIPSNLICYRLSYNDLVPLNTIELQLLEDCKRLGLNAIAGSQVNTAEASHHTTKDTEALF